MSLRTPGHWIQTTFSRSPGQYFLNPAHTVCTSCGEIADWQQWFEYPLKWTTPSEFRQHSDIPPGLLIHILNISLFVPLCLSFLHFLLPFHPSLFSISNIFISITRRRQRVYFQVLLHIRHSYTSSKLSPKGAQQWPSLCTSSLASSEASDPGWLLKDSPNSTSLPESDSPGEILLNKQDVRSIQHCL